MKHPLFLSILLLLTFTTSYGQTWSEWFKQKKTQQKYLLTQVAKLQLYLGYVKKGYAIASDGLRLVGDIKSGDFNLHNGYFNHLKTVSPVIRRYQKVAMIVQTQAQLLRSYSDAYQEYRSASELSTHDVDACYQVFSAIIDDALSDLTQLQTVLSDGALEMTDEERTNAIDAIYTSISEKKQAMQGFILSVSGLISQRRQAQKDMDLIGQLLP